MMVMIPFESSGNSRWLPFFLSRLLGRGVVCFEFLVLFHAIVRTIAAEPMPAGYTIPVVDISAETNRQVIVDREPGQYLGHPPQCCLKMGKPC